MSQFSSTTIEEHLNLAAFAQVAALEFERNPQLATVGTAAPGTYLAIRWGLMDRGVLVVKLDGDFPPVNFTDCIKAK